MEGKGGVEEEEERGKGEIEEGEIGETRGVCTGGEVGGWATGGVG